MRLFECIPFIFLSKGCGNLRESSIEEQILEKFENDLDYLKKNRDLLKRVMSEECKDDYAIAIKFLDLNNSISDLENALNEFKKANHLD